jgi:hypothetical protein
MVYSSYYGSELGFLPTFLPSFSRIFLVVHGYPWLYLCLLLHMIFMVFVLGYKLASVSLLVLIDLFFFVCRDIWQHLTFFCGV